MKKIGALLLTLTVLLMSTAAFAEGPLYDKPIQFAEFNFGDTFQNVRNSQFIRNIEFKRAPFSPRFLAEAISYVAEWTNTRGQTALCFSASLESSREVAGHNCGVQLWFSYPSAGAAESEATLYAGEYEFWEDDVQACFEDLQQKLTKLYGEPYAQCNELNSVFGELSISEDVRNMYDEECARYNPEYVVWKSSANNTAVVLKKYMENGDWMRLKLQYLWLDAQEQFDSFVPNDGGAAADDFAGL